MTTKQRGRCQVCGRRLIVEKMRWKAEGYKYGWAGDRHIYWICKKCPKDRNSGWTWTLISKAPKKQTA